MEKGHGWKYKILDVQFQYYTLHDVLEQNRYQHNTSQSTYLRLTIDFDYPERC